MKVRIPTATQIQAAIRVGHPDAEVLSWLLRELFPKKEELKEAISSMSPLANPEDCILGILVGVQAMLNANQEEES